MGRRTARFPGRELSHQLAGMGDRAGYLRSAAEMLTELSGGDVVGWNAVDRVALDRATAPPLPVLDAAVVGRMRLTTREAGVEHHVGAGLAADAVADLLRISTRTVCEHLEDVYRELDRHDPAGGRAARSRPGPATAPRAAGLIRPPLPSVDGGQHGSRARGRRARGPWAYVQLRTDRRGAPP